jgi:hypothetical protein
MNNQITKQQNSIQTIQNPIFDLIINEVSVVKKKIVDYVNQSAGSAVQKKSDMIKNIECNLKSFTEKYNLKKQEMEVLFYENKNKSEIEFNEKLQELNQRVKGGKLLDYDYIALAGKLKIDYNVDPEQDEYSKQKQILRMTDRCFSLEELTQIRKDREYLRYIRIADQDMVKSLTKTQISTDINIFEYSKVLNQINITNEHTKLLKMIHSNASVIIELKRYFGLLANNPNLDSLLFGFTANIIRNSGSFGAKDDNSIVNYVNSYKSTLKDYSLYSLLKAEPILSKTKNTNLALADIVEIIEPFYQEGVSLSKDITFLLNL